MKSGEAEKLQAARVKLFRDAANFVRPARIPHLSSAVTWKIFDAGHTITEAMQSFDVMEECNRAFLQKYPVDALLDIGIRNQFNVTDAFGPGAYYYYTDNSVGIRDHAHCTPETLMEYLDDPLRYTWTRILPEKYGEDWANKDLAVWKKTFAEYMKFTKFIFRMNGVMKEFGIPPMAPNNPMSGAITFGIEELEANLLGIRRLSAAMRRSPQILDEFIECWDREHIDPIIEKVKKSKGPDYKYCFDASVMMLAHNIMSTQQFERFYWPGLRRLLDAYAEKKMNIRIFCEGSILRFADYFKDYPKGVLTLHLEQDDPYAVREALPNVCIMGGLTTDMLSGRTPEECVAAVKRLCDELGADGGLIISENKMLSYRGDSTPENMKAVCEFLASYEPGDAVSEGGAQ